MIRTVFILTEGPTFFPILRTELLRHVPGLAVVQVQSRLELDMLDPDALAQGRLVGFTTRVIVPAAILAACGHGAYNLHPGPPAFPGWRPVSFAVYEGAHRFGVTAHVMAPTVDTGSIVGRVDFDVPPGIDETGLNNRMVLALLRLFNLLARSFATRTEPLGILPDLWGSRRYTRREADALCAMPPDIPRTECERRVRAFGAGPPGSRPRIRLHGRDFVLEPRADEIVAMPTDLVLSATLAAERG